MIKTSTEILVALGEALRARRVALNLSQEEAARRAGIGVRTLRRIESAGQGTIESLVNVAVAMRCEEKLGDIFPLPPARSMDELMQQQRQAAELKRPQRARRMTPR
ncbi:DNA-binding protein [Candidatus Viadribacter manganicus]|uniref:DNA-binding protein n=2 Tax=Candidatus Viadribacter manganicus TaxID=1759059 RepID=A0A1B1AN84_9PROT|nr:DNA-binding protein [Candidatus Viadribacter manganicus]